MNKLTRIAIKLKDIDQKKSYFCFYTQSPNGNSYYKINIYAIYGQLPYLHKNRPVIHDLYD